MVDNRAVGPADFTRYSITVPTDARLPDSGQTISGLYELVPGKVGAGGQLTTFADDYGKQIEHWNGVDFTINARPSDGVTLQGGWSTGRTSDRQLRPAGEAPGDHDLLASPRVRRRTIGLTAIPDSSATSTPSSSTSTSSSGRTWCRRSTCSSASTYQATPGPEINANYVVTQALTNPSTPLSGGLRIVNVPGAWQGVREAHPAARHPLREDPALRPHETSLSMDLANVLNANYSQAITQAYGARWPYPVSIMDGGWSS